MYPILNRTRFRSHGGLFYSHDAMAIEWHHEGDISEISENDKKDMDQNVRKKNENLLEQG